MFKKSFKRAVDLGVILAFASAVVALGMYSPPLNISKPTEQVNKKGIVIIESGQSMGTGFYVRKDLIVTNHHVVAVKGEDKWKKAEAVIGTVLSIVDEHNNVVNGVVVAFDEKSDLALITTNTQVAFLPLDVREATMNEAIYTIGHGNFKFYDRVDGHTTYKYLLRAEGQDVMYQMGELAINPGHSGSPVFDMDREVIGVISRGGGGIALFVPIQYVVQLLKKYDKERNNEGQKSQ